MAFMPIFEQVRERASEFDFFHIKEKVDFFLKKSTRQQLPTNTICN